VVVFVGSIHSGWEPQLGTPTKITLSKFAPVLMRPFMLSRSLIRFLCRDFSGPKNSGAAFY
jgi:hypothetical protein